MGAISRKWLATFMALSVIMETAVTRTIIYDRNRPWYQEEGAPGVKVRLTQKGMNYLRQVAVLIMNDQIPQVKHLKASGDFGDAIIQLSEINVTRWRPADYTLLRSTPPNKLVFGMENADLGLEADFLATQSGLTLPGKIIGEAQGITVATELESSYADGGLLIKPTSCKAVIQRSTFEVVPQPGHNLANFVKPHIPAMNNAIRAFLPTIFCQTMQSILEGAGRNLLSAERLNIPLTQQIIDDVNDRAASKIKDADAARVTQSAASVLLDKGVIDMTLTREPISTFDYVETWHRGDVYYSDNEYYRTPFQPRPMPSFPDTDKMLYVQMSEYSINALLYQLYLNDKLTMTFDPETAPGNMAKFLRTSCEGGVRGEDAIRNADDPDVFDKVCVGSLLPSLNDAYPNRDVQLVFYPHGVPDFKFQTGSGVLNMQGRLYVNVKANGLEQVLVANVDMRADIPLAIEDSKFVAKDFKLSNLDLYVHRTTLENLNPRNVEQLSPVAKQILTPQIAKTLNDGIPLPLNEGLRLNNAELITREGYMILATDIELDEIKLQEEFKDEFVAALSAAAPSLS